VCSVTWLFEIFFAALAGQFGLVILVVSLTLVLGAGNSAAQADSNHDIMDEIKRVSGSGSGSGSGSSSASEPVLSSGDANPGEQKGTLQSSTIDPYNPRHGLSSGSGSNVHSEFVHDVSNGIGSINSVEKSRTHADGKTTTGSGSSSTAARSDGTHWTGGRLAIPYDQYQHQQQ